MSRVKISARRARSITSAKSSRSKIGTPPNARWRSYTIRSICSVPRKQVAKARGVLDYIRAVRADPIGSRADKQALLSRIDGVRLTPEVIDQILDLPEDTWQRVTQEVVAVIDSALRDEIRDTNVEETKARLPARVAIDLNEQQTQLVSQIAQNFIIANRLRNDEATAAARQAARDKVAAAPARDRSRADHRAAGRDRQRSCRLRRWISWGCASRRSTGIPCWGMAWLRCWPPCSSACMCGALSRSCWRVRARCSCCCCCC